MDQEKKELFEDWIEPTETEIDDMYARDDEAITRCNVVMMKCVSNAKEIVEKHGGDEIFAWPVAIGMFNAVMQQEYPPQLRNKGVM